MTTSSLFHLFRIEGEENVKRFLDAYEASLEAEPPKSSCNVKIVRTEEDKEEFFAGLRAAREARKLKEQKEEAMRNDG